MRDLRGATANQIRLKIQLAPGTEARLLFHSYWCSATRAKVRQYLRHNDASSFYTIGYTPVTTYTQCNTESLKEIMS